MSSIKLEKLDRRHTGHSLFKFRAYIIGRHDGNKFAEIRNALWEAYGPSSERDLNGWCGPNGTQINPHWAWHIETTSAGSFHYYLYLTSDEEASFFKLKWM